MKPKLATSCFVIASVLTPALHAADFAAEQQEQQLPASAKDQEITEMIRNRLAEEKTANLAHVKVYADRNGNVLLSGKVDTRSEEEKAVSIARATEGVKLVRSNIQIINDD